MPCKKCKDGKYKYGNTGECKYSTKEACEKANPNKYNKMKEYPTPLGKKTYDEYAKELKEFNLSKVEKVELESVGVLNAIAANLEKRKTEANKLIKDYTVVRKVLGKDKDKLEELQKRVTKIEEEDLQVRRNMASLADEIDKFDVAFATQIDKFKKAAKELGVDVPTKKYEKLASEMFAIRNKLIKGQVGNL